MKAVLADVDANRRHTVWCCLRDMVHAPFADCIPETKGCDQEHGRSITLPEVDDVGRRTEQVPVPELEAPAPSVL